MKEVSRLVEDDVSRIVSQIIADHLEVDVAQVRSGASFVELRSDFDSLTVVEIQNLVEEHFGIPIKMDAEQDTFPMCLQELVALIMRCATGAPATGLTLPGRAP